jgi:hypothetical protein
MNQKNGPYLGGMQCQIYLVYCYFPYDLFDEDM